MPRFVPELLAELEEAFPGVGLRPAPHVRAVHLVPGELRTMPVLQNVDGVPVPPRNAVGFHYLLIPWISSFHVIDAVIASSNTPVNNFQAALVDQKYQEVHKNHCQHCERLLLDRTTPVCPPYGSWRQHAQHEAPHVDEGLVAVLRVVCGLPIQPQHDPALPGIENHAEEQEPQADGACVVGVEVECDKGHRREDDYVGVLHPEQERHEDLRLFRLPRGDGRGTRRLGEHGPQRPVEPVVGGPAYLHDKDQPESDPVKDDWQQDIGHLTHHVQHHDLLSEHCSQVLTDLPFCAH
mmetsp:Transcript_20246/g.55875  ORF Transcript_20246/g.55875 Transcript_20246/m.55875 type:complete len:294 (-) Transcript_20246:352-1233(-)